MLEDRVRAFEGRTRRYGTQYDWDEAGQLGPLPVEDLGRVDELRRSVGLDPLEENTRRIREETARAGERPPADWSEWRRRKRGGSDRSAGTTDRPGGKPSAQPQRPRYQPRYRWCSSLLPPPHLVPPLRHVALGPVREHVDQVVEGRDGPQVQVDRAAKGPPPSVPSSSRQSAPSRGRGATRGSPGPRPRHPRRGRPSPGPQGRPSAPTRTLFGQRSQWHGERVTPSNAPFPDGRSRTTRASSSIHESRARR